MRNAGGIFGDATVVRERDYGFSVLEARRTQNKPLGLEDGGTAFTVAFADFFQQGHDTGSWLKIERGIRHPVSPFKNPLCGSAGLDWMPAD
jgi:hypothetical protein